MLNSNAQIFKTILTEQPFMLEAIHNSSGALKLQGKDMGFDAPLFCVTGAGAH